MMQNTTTTHLALRSLRDKLSSSCASDEAESGIIIDLAAECTRRHSHLGGLSPEQFEAAQKQRPLGVH